MDAEPLLGASPDSIEKYVPSVRPSGSVAPRVPVMSLFSEPEPVISPVMSARRSKCNVASF